MLVTTPKAVKLSRKGLHTRMWLDWSLWVVNGESSQKKPAKTGSYNPAAGSTHFYIPNCGEAIAGRG